MLDCHVFFICALLPFSLTPVRDESSASRILPTSIPQRIRLRALCIAHSTVNTYVRKLERACRIVPDSTSDPHSTDAPALTGNREAVGRRREGGGLPTGCQTNGHAGLETKGLVALLEAASQQSRMWREGGGEPAAARRIVCT